MAVIETHDLVKAFGKLRALDGLDLSVEGGQVFGFIGPNGAGKTTTIRTLLGVYKATSGTAEVFGKNAWTDAVSIHEQVAYVPGDVNLWPTMSGGEVIDFFLRLRDGSGAAYAAAQKRREELLKNFELDPTKKCRSYSKGNRQKVALVAALASDVDLYIFDEPTSGLDPLMEKVFQNYVAEIKAAGKTIFLSSHILSEVERLCDNVGIIRKGKLVEHGTLDELRSRWEVKGEALPSLEEVFMKQYGDEIHSDEGDEENEMHKSIFAQYMPKKKAGDR
ncbi:MAG: ABC transporter ATP-binding protein [Coriobacteriia bacterium]|nr:ABC transporter ATP-binding protein [Coriobacteriia bacterium]